jgi:SAM-dependent methyltransferase
VIRSVARVIRARSSSAAKDLIARLPFLAAKELVYDRRFFETTDPHHVPMYTLLADSIVELEAPASVVDVGCGAGILLERFQERNVEIRGIEGSRHAIELSGVRDHILRANLEHGVPAVGRFDLACCIEVAEHLPARSAKGLVDGLTRLSDAVVFTAALPGQGGTHHVNERPHAYWEGLFARAGFERDNRRESELKERIAAIPEPAWMRMNLMVFRRAAQSD